ncbi:MAG: hypothetical protein HUJ26_09085 [Planctomycetaceae bacterium]|nr:hypothetical protein [Planctomycetaceae bacterium]
MLDPAIHLRNRARWSETRGPLLSSLWMQEGDIEERSGVDRSPQRPDRNQANERYRQAENEVKTIEKELQLIQEEYEREKAGYELEKFFSKVVRDIDRPYKNWNTEKQGKPPLSFNNRVLVMHDIIFRLTDTAENWDQKSPYHERVTRLSETAQKELKKIVSEADDDEKLPEATEEMSKHVKERYSGHNPKKENEPHLMTDLENLRQFAGCAPAES